MGRAGRILVAVPGAGLQREIEELLGREGYEVVRAARGSEAILTVLGQEVDLALIGLDLTDPDGFQTIEILHKVRPRLPLVVFSSDPAVDVGRRIWQQGIYYYLLEPLNPTELKDVVGSALRKGQGAQHSGGSRAAVSALETGAAAPAKAR